MKTKYHGTQEIAEEDIIHFNNGLPGFPDERNFTILPLDDENPFLILQSTETAELAFVIAVPFDFYSDYDVMLSEDTLEQLQITTEKEVALFSILTVHEVFEKSTINLKAPVVINSTKRLGKQVVLNEEKYETRTPLLNAEKTVNKEGS